MAVSHGAALGGPDGLWATQLLPQLVELPRRAEGCAWSGSGADADVAFEDARAIIT